MGRETWLLPVALEGALEAALNAALALDPHTTERLTRLQGRVIGIELRNTPLSFYVTPTAEGLRVSGRFAGEPDTLLKGSLAGFAAMGSGKAGGGMFSGEVTIHGDVELGQHFKAILDRLEIDWEEHLSHLTGDLIAHQLGSGLRSLSGWLKRSGGFLGEDLRDYLQEESRVLAHPIEVNDFLGAVDTLRADTDRLAARIELLRQRLGG